VVVVVVVVIVKEGVMGLDSAVLKSTSMGVEGVCWSSMLISAGDAEMDEAERWWVCLKGILLRCEAVLGSCSAPFFRIPLSGWWAGFSSSSCFGDLYADDPFPQDVV
jgi:hypothetical protein